MSARRRLLLAHGVRVGSKVVVVIAEGADPSAYRMRGHRRARRDREVTVIHGDLVAATGSSRVTGCVVREHGAARSGS